jgi:hypothetical protein
MGAPEILSLILAVMAIIGGVLGGLKLMMNGLKSDIARIDKLVSNHIVHELQDQGERIARLEAQIQLLLDRR